MVHDISGVHVYVMQRRAKLALRRSESHQKREFLALCAFARGCLPVLSSSAPDNSAAMLECFKRLGDVG